MRLAGLRYRSRFRRNRVVKILISKSRRNPKESDLMGCLGNGDQEVIKQEQLLVLLAESLAAEADGSSFEWRRRES